MMTLAPEQQRKRLLEIQSSLIGNQNFKVLIVDDDESDLILTQNRLKSFGIESITTVHGGVAEEMISQNGFAVIFLDWKLVGVSGLSVLRSIKLKCPKCVVIILTGVATNDDAVIALNNGAALVMSKPITDEAIKIIFDSPFP